MNRLGLSMITALAIAGSAHAFGPGDRVLGTWGTGLYEFPASVTSVEGDQVILAYDDGMTATNPSSMVRPFDWKAGSEISCRWKGRKKWYKGAVLSITGPSIHMRYNDGDEETIATGLCRCTKDLSRAESQKAPAATVIRIKEPSDGLVPGGFRVRWRDHASKWTGPVFDASGTPSKWKGEQLGTGNMHLLTWPETPGDSKGSQPAKYLLFFAKGLVSPRWNSATVQQWFDHEAPKQLDWYLEVAPDVRQLLDLNPSPNMTVFVAVELENGDRHPVSGGFFDTRYPKAERVDASQLPAIAANAVRVPEGYAWPR